jgi:hypothetical protein
MEAAGQDKFWLAREVVRSLVRALDARGAAAPAASADPRAEFSKSMRGFVRRHGRFRVEAATHGLKVGSETLADDEKGSFARVAVDLLNGGIRELSVEPGVTEEELERVLIALTPEGDGDLATRVLESGVDHVDVRSLDYVATLERPEGYSPELRTTLSEMQKSADEMAKALEESGEIGKGTLVYEVTDSGGEFARLSRIRPRAIAPSDSDEGDIIAVSPEALRALRAKALDLSTGDEVLVSLVDFVLQGFTLDPAALGPDNAKWFLETAPALAIRDGNLRLLAAILERYTTELTAASGPVAAALHAVIQGLSTKESLAKLVALGSASLQQDAFCSILEALGPPGVSAALSAYERTTSKEVREALNEFLVENVASCPEALRPLVEPTAVADTARFALFLASKSLKGEAADAIFEVARAHPHQQVSTYAHFLLRTHTPRGRLKALLESLDKNDVTERIRAVDALARAKDREALDPIVKLIDDPSFLNRTPEEMKSFLNAVKEIGGAEMIRFFQRQSERSSGIFRIRAGSEVRDQAREMLKRLVERDAKKEEPKS